MTFDTFDKYNTDEAYNDKGTTAKGLVEAYKKDNPEGTADDFYAKLNKTWAQDKDGYVKNAVNEAFKAKEEPKAEEKTAPKVEEMTQTTEALEKEEPEEKDEGLKAPNLSKGDREYIQGQRDRADNSEVTELNKIDDRSDYNYKKLYDTTARMSDAYKNIDDKLIAQLPTFMFKRYQQGEFGDPKSGDAKLRLAYFAMNNVVSKLKKLYNADSIVRGQGPIFNDTESAYDKYQQTNLEEGLRNRWNKYKAETDNAIALASKETMTEQEARHTVEQLTRNQNMNTVWNTMNENQKLYAMEVTKKIGDYVGNMDISELGDFIAGAAYEGKMDKDKVIAIGIAKLAENSPEILDKLKDGSMKDMVMSFIGSGVTAGIGGAGGKKDSEGNTTNFTGNIQNYKGVDGNELSFDFQDPKAKEKINGEITKLKEKYNNGEIDAETFKAYYDPLYKEGKRHFSSFTTPSSDSALKVLNSEKLGTLEEEFEALNKKAKAGEIKPSDYKEKLAKLSESAEKYGASKEMLSFIKNKTVSDATILKAADKKAKKNK